MNRLRFFLHSWRDMPTVGTVTKSSRFLAAKICNQIDFEAVKRIVELGAGDGPITKVLLERMPVDSALHAFEIKPEFCFELEKLRNGKQFEIVQDSAENIASHVAGDIDCVVSGLPLARFPKGLREGIVKAAYDSLRPGGLYLQFQYSPQAYGLFRRTFSSVKLRWTPLNIPPAFVYICTK